MTYHSIIEIIIFKNKPCNLLINELAATYSQLRFSVYNFVYTYCGLCEKILFNFHKVIVIYLKVTIFIAIALVVG